MHKTPSIITRLPFTTAMLAGLAITALLTNTAFEAISRHWLNRAGFAPNDLWYWRVERLFTSALVTSGGKVFWEAVFFVVFAVGLAEWLAGWKRAAATFWGVHLVTLVLLSLIISLLLHQLQAFGFEVSEAARDVGPSAGYFACLGLVTARLRRPWHWIGGAVLLTLFAIVIFLPTPPGESAVIKFSADLAHLIAFPLGWLSGLGRKFEGSV